MNLGVQRVVDSFVPSVSYFRMTEQDSLTLTPQPQHLIDILRAAGRWVNRTELAKLAGESALNKWDIVLQTKLIDETSRDSNWCFLRCEACG